MSKSSRNKSKKQLAKTKDVTVAMETREEWQGLICHPDDFEKYEIIFPGAAKFLLDQAKTEQDNRIRQNDKYLTILADDNTGERKLRSQGQWFGFIVTLSAFGVCLYALKLGYPIAAGTIFVAIAALTGVFFYKRSEESIKSN